MKLLLVCLVLLGCTVSHVSTSEQTELMKRLLTVLENKLDENTKNERRNLRRTPAVDPSRPGEIQVNLDIDQDVKKACGPGCKVYIYFQCHSDACSDKDMHRFPDVGYTWTEFHEKFETEDSDAGVVINGLESGMEYEVWDTIFVGSLIYHTYGRTAVVIP